MFPNLIESFGYEADLKKSQDKFLSIAADDTLEPNEQIVHVTGFSGAVAVTLPPVGACAGRAFIIKVLDDASVNNITIQDQDDSRSWSDLTCSNASGGHVILWSDGAQFFTMASLNVS